MASRREEILLRLRLKGQAATHAGLNQTTRDVKQLDAASRRLNLGLAVLGNENTAGSNGLNALQQQAAGLESGLTGLGASALAVVPLLIAVVGPVAALTSALGPLVGLAGAAGDGLLAAGQGAGVFELAINGVDKALKASGDPKAYAAALNSLPPAARQFTQSLVSMKPLLDNLRQNAAAGFFPGAEKGLASAARNFGPVQRIVAATAHVLGDLAAAAGQLIGSPAFGRDLETIGGRNAKVIDTLGHGALHLVSALRYVALAAGPLTQWLADTAAGWARNADGAAKAGEQSGKLAAFFERTRAILERLGSILGHVTSGLLGIGRAGTDSGNSMWSSFNRAAIAFDTWANSTKGQRDLKEFFEESRQLAAAFIPVIGGVTQGLALLSLRLLPVTTVLQWLGPRAGDAAIAFVAWKLAITGITVAAKAWGAIAAVAAFATGGWATAFWTLDAAMDANPIGLTIIAVAALAAGLIYAYNHSKTFRDGVNDVWGALKDGYGWLKDNWPLLLQILVGPIGLAIGLIKQNFGSVVDFIRDRINNLITAINGPANLINKVLPGNPAPRIRKIGHRASGGPTPAGDFLVGEEGPEIVRLPVPGHVFDAGTSAAMAAGGKQGAGDGGGLPGLIAALHRQAAAHEASARRPIVVVSQLDGREIARSTALHWADDAAFR